MKQLQSEAQEVCNETGNYEENKTINRYKEQGTYFQRMFR
jgi:hypothetical protein